MKILVPLKRVADPDNANKIRVSADGSEVTTDGLEGKMNPFDEWALEGALRLTENGASKERTGEVVVVSIGPKDATTVLRQGMAMGADRGILVEGADTALDSGVVAAALQKIAAEEQPDLIMMGKQAADGDSGAAAQMLAEHLGWPVATYVATITTEDGGAHLKVDRELDTGLLTMNVQTPAVITASDRIVQPEAVKNGVTPGDFAYPESDGGRYASLPGIMKAKRKPLKETTLGELGVEGGAKVTYFKFEMPPARSGETVFVESADELVQKLNQDAKVL